MSKGEETRYCRFALAVGKRNVCPYVEEECTIMFCIACRATKLASQQDLLIKQNKAVILLLNQIRDLLRESSLTEFKSKRTPKSKTGEG
jgi:hypothetical protein